MNRATTKVAVGVGKGLLKVLRFSLYVMLLLLGRVLLPVANWAICAGIIVFLFCLLVRPDLTTPMWAGAGLAAIAAAVSVFYEAALRFVAPAGVVIFSDG